MGTVETYADIRKRADRFARLAVTIAAVGLLYVAGSLGLMWHLMKNYDETCASRQADRLTYRELIMDLPGWTAQDQALLDLRLPAHLEC